MLFKNVNTPLALNKLLVFSKAAGINILINKIRIKLPHIMGAIPIKKWNSFKLTVKIEL